MTISYFMDECTFWELNDIIDNLPYLDRNNWEQARLNAYIVALVNSKKTLKMQDICNFKWELGDLEKNTEISNEDIERLRNKANEYIQHGIV